VFPCQKIAQRKSRRKLLPREKRLRKLGLLKQVQPTDWPRVKEALWQQGVVWWERRVE
jgi:hypothetical protein